MFKKSLFAKKRKLSDEMSLQITSMADIFTILLVFLLKSYATTSVAPSAGTSLPEAFAGELGGDALKVEVTAAGVSIEGEMVLPMEAYKFAPKEINSDGTLKSLITRFDQQRQRQVAIAKENSNVSIDPRVVVLADKKVPYQTLKAVLASAATQGYTDFKLAVVKPE